MKDGWLHFNEFKIGDYVWFERSFRRREFATFSKLSGDKNPLHHDRGYGIASEFGDTIVPLHMVAAPLSAIAGNIFPGEPALYLGHELHASAPVYFGDTITYSAKIESLSASSRVITFRAIAFKNATVVLDANVRVRCRDQIQGPAPAAQVNSASSPRTVLVTGAGGTIGAATARSLARAGYNLVLHSRRGNVSEIVEDCTRFGVNAKTIRGSLTSSAEIRKLVRTLQSQIEVDCIVHAASPPPDAPREEIVAVNFGALKELGEATVPTMLRRQQGNVVFIGSAATETVPNGWEEYAAAKSMTVNWVNALDRRFGKFGIAGLTIAPGFVRTSMSEGRRPPGVSVLMPEEVGESIVQALREPKSANGYWVLERGRIRRGHYGFVEKSKEQSRTTGEPVANQTEQLPRELPTNESDFDIAVRGFLGLHSGDDLENGGPGITRGWDSLRHIELLLFLEQRFGVRFAAADMADAIRFTDLKEIWRKAMSERRNPMGRGSLIQ